MKYSIDMQIGQLSENGDAVAIFDKYLPGVRGMITKNPQSAGLSIRNLVKYMGGKIPASVLEGMDAELQKLNTPENRISHSEKRQIALFQEMESDRRAKEKAVPANVHHQDAVYPGQPWYDTSGQRIQAHGGAVFYENGTYYWYGENKEFTDGSNGIWTWGIGMYASQDLYNWTNLGLVIPPVLDDPDSPLFPTKRVDRPHILKCPATGKYVCWIKLSGAEATFVILEADTLTGPYHMVREDYRPQGRNVGDFDLICDEETGKAYLYYDKDHQALTAMELAEDYLSAKKVLSEQYAELHPPFTREGPALFEANGFKYLLTSGMTGYIPNQSDAAKSLTWDGPFESVGNPHVNDPSNASFNSQISKIFRVEGENLWIAMADRWVVDFPVDAKLADIFTRTIASRYEPDKYQATETEKQLMAGSPSLETANTSIADYVWLPITLDEAGEPKIEWQDSWSVGNQ